jgi:ATP-dependent Clp protease adaptor protein ClpS
VSEQKTSQDNELEFEDDESLLHPRNFVVIMHNDNYTTMEFVVKVLKEIFHHSDEAASEIMLQIHEKGQAVVGSYSREIAEIKAAITISLARKEGFPLLCTIKAN